MSRWRNKLVNFHQTPKRPSEIPQSSIQPSQGVTSSDQFKNKDLDKATDNKSSNKCQPKIQNCRIRFTTNLDSCQPKVETPQSKRRSQQERDIFTQLSLIIAAFMLGYMPTAIYQVWTIDTRSNFGEDINADYWFGVVSYLCLRFSESLNAIIYNIGSGEMRKATKKLLKYEK